ncbi:hypothetical protein R1sor_025303 [Riccia sorocarpa]|uniref:CRM domain-containing protein n=1 Tax=Riccia sorocarpa TaxID=122646 RepID=A0ABD3GBH8_9MARC
MIGVLRLPQLRGQFWFTSAYYNGRSGTGSIADRGWTSRPTKGFVDISWKRRHGVLRSFRFCNPFCCEAGIPGLRHSNLKGSFSVRAFSSQNIPEEAPKEDLASFRPPPRAPPVTPQELIAEVPFHYWYSYADLPDNSSKKPKRRQKKLEDPEGKVWMEPAGSLRLQPEGQKATPISSESRLSEQRQLLLDGLEVNSDSFAPREEETRTILMRKLTNNSSLRNVVSLEPRRSLMREEKKTTSSTSKSGERRSLMREPKATTSSSNSNERRSLIREPRSTSIISNSQENKGVDEVASALISRGARTREECAEMVGSQGTVETVLDRVASSEPAERAVGRSMSGNSSAGEIEGEHKKLADGTEEGTGLEKAAFRLTKQEINLMVDKCNRSSRQINIGWRGWGHNYIMLIHSYWKKSEVCKIKCKGAITLNMDYFCNKLELKTGGRVIHRNLGVVYLYRGKEYDPRLAPKLPVLHQRKQTQAKRLQIPFGLTKDDVNALRARGKELPALCKLAKNGVYVTLVDDIRKAFEKSDLVRVNCQGFEARNFRTLGVKLKKLVPCVLISYEFEHILMWRWDGYKVPGPQEEAVLAEESFTDEEEEVEESLFSRVLE